MSGYPIVLDGASIAAVVVGGGAVAERKVRALVEAGARVQVIAPDMSDEVKRIAAAGGARLTRARFEPAHLDGATLVFAATNDAAVNAAVAREARSRGIAVNVADAPETGSFVTPAVHRAGDLIVAVTAGGVPAVAARIRDDIAASIGVEYATAVAQLVALRRTLIDRGERDRWRDASAALIGPDFRDAVESGGIPARIDAWR